jgi:fructose/tagatose bisphosphate aldolase
VSALSALRAGRQAGIDGITEKGLAVAIGTAHGEYKGRPALDFERLAAIRKLVDGSGILQSVNPIYLYTGSMAFIPLDFCITRAV